MTERQVSPDDSRRQVVDEFVPTWILNSDLRRMDLEYILGRLANIPCWRNI